MNSRPNSYQLLMGFGATVPVGRIIPNPPGLTLTASNRRVKDNAPYLGQLIGYVYAVRFAVCSGFQNDKGVLVCDDPASARFGS